MIVVLAFVAVAVFLAPAIGTRRTAQPEVHPAPSAAPDAAPDVTRAAGGE